MFWVASAVAFVPLWLLARLRGPYPGTMLLWTVALVAIVAGGYTSALLVRGIEAGKFTRVGITSADALLSLVFAASTMLGNIVWRTREHNRQRVGRRSGAESGTRSTAAQHHESGASARQPTVQSDSPGDGRLRQRDP